MNKSAIFSLSILANVGLAAGLAYVSTRKPAPQQAPAAVAQHVETGAIVRPARNLTPSGKRSLDQARASQFSWRQVETDDYKKYVANLRAIECPEETIRDIIIADVNKAFLNRQRAKAEPYKFWKASKNFGNVNPEKVQELLDLAKEKKALLKDLLGVDVGLPSLAMENMDPMNEMLSFLPQEKQNRLTELEAEFGVKQMKTMSSEKGRSGKETVELYKSLQEEKRAEMAKILTPQELEEYDLRMSPTSHSLRSSLGEFETSEQEFRDLFKIRKKFDDQSMQLASTGESVDRDQRKLAQLEMNNEIKQTMGEERYNQFQHEKEWSQSSLRKLSEEFKVPKDNVLQAFDIRKETQEEALKIRTDQNLTDEQKKASLDQLRNISEESWKKVLGAEAFDAYSKKSSPWFEEVSPRKPRRERSAGPQTDAIQLNF